MEWIAMMVPHTPGAGDEVIKRWVEHFDAATCERWSGFMRKRIEAIDAAQRMSDQEVLDALRACKPGDALYRGGFWGRHYPEPVYFVRCTKSRVYYCTKPEDIANRER